MTKKNRSNHRGVVVPNKPRGSRETDGFYMATIFRDPATQQIMVQKAPRGRLDALDNNVFYTIKSDAARGEAMKPEFDDPDFDVLGYYADLRSKHPDPELTACMARYVAFKAKITSTPVDIFDGDHPPELVETAERLRDAMHGSKS